MSELSAAEIKIRIKREAQRLGFELVGVTTPEPPPHLETYRRWLDLGRHGEMGYLSRERNLRRRADPLEILPECQSILVLGMNYLPQDASAATAESAARIASYALGDDYHEVIPDRLKKLASKIEDWVGEPVPHRYYTDTGPILERDLAQRAGLGWIGKNTCLINTQKGSYFFLAELFLGLDLPPDEPVTTDHCGSCTRCLEACPTGCILPDRTLDARRCISYLTIELKEEIPIEMRSQTENWVFGCDICQQVCPWNQRFAEPTAEPAYQPRPFFDQIRPEAFLQISDEDYRRVFKGSPLKRAKRRGLARNAAVALGNRRDPAAIPLLRETLLEDEETLPRQHAAWALGQFENSSARKALQQALSREEDPEVRREIRTALNQRDPK